MPKNFYDLLKKNGVSIPMRWWMEPAWIFEWRMKNFRLNWAAASDAYHKYLRAAKCMENAKLWEWCDNSAYTLFGKHIDRTPVPDIDGFKTAQEAETVINKAISKCKDPHEELVKIAADHRKQWFMKLVEERPEGCTLIVVKNPNYNPNEENEKGFMEDVRRGQASEIAYFTGLSYTIRWTAIPVNKAEEERFEQWAIDTKTAVVEYY